MSTFTLKVLLRMWHGGVFTNNNSYNGKYFLDIRDYDIFNYGDRFLDELLLADYGYGKVIKYAFKNQDTGEFIFVNFDDVSTDFVSLALQYVDRKNVLEIYCECEDGRLIADGIQKEEAILKAALDKGKGKAIDEGDKGKGKGTIVLDDDQEDEDDPDFELDDLLVEEDPISEDGMEDGDFTDEDEEFFEARRTKKVYINNLSEIRKEREKEKEKQQEKLLAIQEAATQPIAADFITVDDELDSDDSYESLDEDGQKKVKTKVYSKNTQPKDLILELGLKFFDTKECQRVVRHWAVANGYNIRWSKSSAGKLLAVCVEGCKWRMYASRIHGEPTWMRVINQFFRDSTLASQH